MAARYNDEDTEKNPEGHNWLKVVLECPGCHEAMPKGPVHACAGNDTHSLCFKCYETMKKCPVCQSQMTGKRILVVESILGQMEQKGSPEKTNIDNLTFADLSPVLVRKIDIENEEKPDVPEWMKKALACPVCLEIIMDPPIYVCENSQGHSMCSTCHRSVQQNDKLCPVCRGKMGERRSHGLESLVEGIPNKVTCRFDGCDFKRSKEEVVVKHEESCEYRLVPCGQCETKICVKKLAEHVFITNVSKELNFDGLCKLKNYFIPRNMRRQQVMKNTADKSRTFLFNWYAVGDGVRAFWISYIGPKEDAKTFKYTLKVKASKNSEKYLLEATKRCVPCDFSFEEVKSKMCAVFIDKDSVEEAREGNDDEKINAVLMIQKV